MHALFTHFLEHPEALPDRDPAEPLPRAVCDFLAGMTDRFAIRMYEQLHPGRPRPAW